MKRLTLSERLILNFLFIGLSAVIVVSTFSFRTTKDALTQRAFEQLTSVLHHKQDELMHYFDDRINDYRYIRSRIEKKATAGEYNHEMIAVIQNALTGNPKINKYFSEIFVFQQGSNAAVLAGYYDSIFSLKYIPVDDPRFDTFFLSEQGEITISDYRKNENSIISPAIVSATECSGGNFIIAMYLRQDHIDALMIENNPLEGMGESGETYLVGNDNLMRSESRFIPGSILHTPVKTPSVETALAGNSGKMVINDYRGIEVLSCYDKLDLPGLEWVILAEMDMYETILPARNARYRIILISVILAFVIFLFALLISRRITSPIRKLTVAAKRISEGKIIDPIENQNNDEIGTLVNTFNDMAEQIEKQKRELRKEKFIRLRSMIDGQEMERQRISRELHDGLGQNLIAIKMKLNSIAGQNTEEQKKTIEEASVWFNKTIDDIRRMSNDLIPEELDSFGLVPATANLLNNLQASTGIQVEYEHQGIKTIHDKKIKTYLFRIIQEAVNNILKHSGATRITIRISTKDDNIYLCIKDDGIGFSNNNFTSGNGILNMKERASLLNGRLEISSSEKKGTKITAIIPCDKTKYEPD